MRLDINKSDQSNLQGIHSAVPQLCFTTFSELPKMIFYGIACLVDTKQQTLRIIRSQLNHRHTRCTFTKTQNLWWPLAKHIISYILFTDWGTGIYPHATSQYHMRPLAECDIVMFHVDKFLYLQKQTRGNKFTPRSNDMYCTLKCFPNFNSLRPSDAIWRQRSGWTLAQVRACCLTAPSHYLNQYWLIICEVQWNSYKGNFIRDASLINH